MKMYLGVKKPNRELSVGEILSQSFSLYSAKLAHFYIIFFVAAYVSRGFGQIVRILFPLPPIPEFAGPLEETLKQFSEWFLPFITTLIVIVALTFIITWIINTIANSVAVKYASDLLEKGDARLWGDIDFTILRLDSLLAVGVITGILILIGLFCLVVPGIILMIMFALVVQTIVIEGVGTLESLGRSKKLVSSRWGKTFIVLLLIDIMILLIELIANLIAGFFGPIGWVIRSLVTAFISPILPIAMTFLYYSMVVKESILASRPPPPPPAVTPAPPTRFCPQCGQQISPDAKFCPRCSKEIEKPF